MKAVLFTLLTLLISSAIVTAQRGDGATERTYTLQDFFPFVDGKVYYSETVTLPDSTSKDKLYARAKDWVHVTFKSAKAVTDQDDRENGRITGEGLSTARWYILTDIPYKFKFRITTKNGKFRYELTDIKIAYPQPYMNWMNRPIEDWDIALNKKKEDNRDLCRNIDSGLKLIGSSIKQHLSNKLRDEDF